MAKIIKQNRTVRFFEAVDHDTTLPFDFDLDWDPVLEGLTHSDMTAEERTQSIAGEDHHGGGWMGTPNMLLLSKIRAGDDLPELLDRNTGRLEDLQLLETQGIAETTHVAFFPRNIIGMVRSTSSPGATQLGTWINKMDLFDNFEHLVDVIPLSRIGVTAKVNDIDRANGIKIRARSTATQAMTAAGAPRLANAIDGLAETFGPVTVEMRVYVTEAQPAVDVRETIMAEAQGLLALTADNQAIEGLEGVKLFYRSLEKERNEELNMLKDKFAERVEVEVIDADGRSTRRSSAADAIQRAYDRLRVDLTNAVDRDRS